MILLIIDKDNIEIFITIGLIIAGILGLIIYYTKPIKLPVKYIKDPKGNILFRIYSHRGGYKVINYLDSHVTEPIIFKHWDEVITYIESEKKEWDITD